MNRAFTICTKSYIGLANSLKQSFLKYNENFEFVIILVDDEKEKIEGCISADEILNNYFSTKEITNLKFKYNVTEYSTFIKPYAFKYLFDLDSSDLVVYLDPDIMFFSRFNEIYDENYLAYITPHHTGMRSKEHMLEEANTLKHGVYNCGFIAFRKSNDSMNFISWWMERLFDGAYEDLRLGLYTDQIWVDFLPVHLFGNVLIIKNKGCNIAPWNYSERKLIIENDKYYVGDREDCDDVLQPLCFAHFSGFDYLKLQQKVVSHKFNDFDKYSDLKDIFNDYGELLRANNAADFLKGKYIYSFFTNGMPITKFHRRIFRELSLKIDLGNPFDSNNDFYKILKKSHLLSKDKLNEPNTFNVSKMGRKYKFLILFYKMVFKILRVDKYCEFIKALHKYSVYEEQIFLVKAKGLNEKDCV